MNRREDTAEDTLIMPPAERHGIVGHARAEEELRQLIDAGNLSNGWLITGPAGLGKATLAYRVARAFLTPDALTGKAGLSIDSANTYIRLIDQKAHPDLFVAERKFDPKKDRLETVISVETIRSLIDFLTLTSSTGRRVAIIDTVDHLNRNAANALLKVLEEPPANTLLLLLAHMPGRLLPTIRSRCRSISLTPLEDAEVADFIIEEAQLNAGVAQDLAAISGGRPGHALILAMGEGEIALPLVEEFLEAAVNSKTTTRFSDKLSPKSADELWRTFIMLLLEKISLTARGTAAGQPSTGALAQLPPSVLVSLWEKLSELFSRGTALNTDRTQLMIAASIAIAKAAQEARAA